VYNTKLHHFSTNFRRFLSQSDKLLHRFKQTLLRFNIFWTRIGVQIDFNLINVPTVGYQLIYRRLFCI